MNMYKKNEQLKIDFLTNLKDENYVFVYSYNRLDECIEIITYRDLITINIKAQIIKLKHPEKLHIQIDGKILIEYYIIEKENKFLLFEINLSTYNDFEKLLFDN